MLTINPPLSWKTVQQGLIFNGNGYMPMEITLSKSFCNPYGKECSLKEKRLLSDKTSFQKVLYVQEKKQNYKKLSPLYKIFGTSKIDLTPTPSIPTPVVYLLI